MEALSRKRWFIVLFACFWVSWFDFGLQTVTGTFFDAMLDYYGSDRTTTASVSGLFTAVNQGFGFVVGLLVQRFGITKISFIGAILVPIGFILNIFAVSVIHVLVCFGVVSALGVAMMFVCSVAMIRKVCTGPFKKWLPLTLTIHSSCISFAGFSLPYLIRFLNNNYALPGTFLIFGGILANNLCVSVLFYFIIKHIDSDSVTPHERQGNTNVPNVPQVETKQSTSLSKSFTIKCFESNECESFAAETTRKSNLDPLKTYALDKYLDMELEIKNVTTDAYAERKLGEDNSVETDTFSVEDKKVSEIFTNELSGENVLQKNETHNIEQNYSNDKIFQTNGKSNLDISLETEISSNSGTQIEVQNVLRKRMISFVARAKDTLFGHVNIMFTCVLLCVAIVIGTQNSYITIIIDMMESKGFPQDMAIHAYIPLNACGLICRILPGIFIKIDPIWFVVFYSFCGTVGQFTLLISSDYTVCMVAVGLTGVTMGGVISAATIVVAKTVDNDRFALAFGQILTGIGIMVTTMTPIYGALRDAWGNYDIVLTTTGVAQSIGALLCIFGWIVNRNYKLK